MGHYASENYELGDLYLSTEDNTSYPSCYDYYKNGAIHWTKIHYFYFFYSFQN